MMTNWDAGRAKMTGLQVVSAAAVFEEEPRASCQPVALCGNEAGGMLPA